MLPNQVEDGDEDDFHYQVNDFNHNFQQMTISAERQRQFESSSMKTINSNKEKQLNQNSQNQISKKISEQEKIKHYNNENPHLSEKALRNDGKPAFNKEILIAQEFQIKSNESLIIETDKVQNAVPDSSLPLKSETPKFSQFQSRNILVHDNNQYQPDLNTNFQSGSLIVHRKKKIPTQRESQIITHHIEENDSVENTSQVINDDSQANLKDRKSVV